MALLEYENQIFLDCFHDDALLLMARGLGIHRVFVKFLKLYCAPENLVLVLNTDAVEEEYFIEQLLKGGVTPLPKTVTTEYSSVDRQRLYLQGGVLFVTPRILVVDMLTDKIPIDKIAGLLVYKAHRIIESSQAAFILRLYRKKNKTGFVKAFSESPLAFTSGYAHVERVMKSLFVRKLFLWPRFQVNIQSYLSKHKVDVIEIHVSLTPAMLTCQTALLDIIDACVKELKICNKSLDTDEITVENALTRGFDKIIHLYLEPIWHLIGPKTKQLVADIKTLRTLLEYLIQYDCVSFYNMVNSLRTNEKNFGKHSGWMFMDAADTLHVAAKQRVFGVEDSAKKKKTDGGKETSKNNIVSQMEPCPKWTSLQEILQEVKKHNTESSLDTEAGRILIAAADHRTCQQIKQVLVNGSQPLLNGLLTKSKGNKSEDHKAPHRGPKAGKNALTLTQMMDSELGTKLNENECDSFGLPSGEHYSVLEEPLVILHPLYSTHGDSLVKTLHHVKPRYVILYDPDMKFVRQLEVFRASRPGCELRVYFLIYSESVEEQRYLTSLRKEKEAFEYLIRQKSTMVISDNQDGKMEDVVEEEPTRQSSRKGGIQAKENIQKKVIVDMREFRSELPSLIHRRGIEIEPVTLEVGDYILSPDLCVERKSLSDLIGSLNCGRLYNQAQSMCRFYKRPVLLIEFDANKPFQLQEKYFITSDINSNDIGSRLTLLTMHFPRLRILWCQSPYATAELFEELKLDQPEPDAATAMSLTAGTDRDMYSFKYNAAPQDMLLKMPGVSTKNVYSIMNRVTNISELSTLSQKKIEDILQSASDARHLWSFLHQDTSSVETSSKADPAKTAKKTTLMKNVKRKR